MNFDPGQLVSFFESRIGRRATTVLAWLLFIMVFVAAAEFLIDHAVLPLERFFGGTGDLRADLITKKGAPFWPALIATLAVLSVSVLLFVPFLNFLIGGRRVPQSVLNELEEQRKWAIDNVYNLIVNNANDLTEWKKRNDQFVETVKKILEKHCSSADVLRFERLGLIWGVPFDSRVSPNISVNYACSRRD